MKITIDDHEYEVGNRTGELIRRAAEMQIQIENIPFGQVRFDLAGRKITPSVTISHRASEAENASVKVKVS